MVNTNKVRSAIKAGDTKGIEEMLKEGLDPNSVLKKDWTLLHLATKAGQSKTVEFLLERGAKVDAQTEMRQTALDVALASQQSEIAQLLKKHGAKKGVELTLHSAALVGDVKWAKKHLDSGADANATDRGDLPLCIALARHRWDVAKLLLKKSPDVNKRQQNRNAALHEAAYAGADNALLKSLLDLGADVNMVGYGSMTPLCYAAYGGHEATARFLMQNGADVAYRAKDGTSPVSEAVHEHHEELARLIIDSGGKCSLHHAVQCGHLAKARQLLSGGADVQERDEHYSGTPMSVAIWDDSIEMVQLLLEFGANPNEQEPTWQGSDGSCGGDTALHGAVYKASAKLVKLLLSRGADPDIPDAHGVSPVELARRRDQSHLVKLMEVQIDRSLLGDSIDQLYTVGKVAELLSVEEAFVTKLLVEGKLRQVRLDPSMIRIPASSVKKYVAKLLK